MEPASIDWKNVESRFVRDELFEDFNAPKWVDLSSPHPFNPGDDDAWFCRPDCRHPKTYEDFLIKNSPSTPDSKGRRKMLGGRNPNVKRRGALQHSMTPLLSSPRAKPATMKKAREEREDLDENRNPNLHPSTPLKAASKLAKEAVKSSAEKPSNEVEIDPRRQLKSTYSARNLFAGKEILAQISDFCGEIRRMATARRERVECGGGNYGKIELQGGEVSKKAGILKEAKKEGNVVVSGKSQCRSAMMDKGPEKRENKGKGIKNSTGECLRLLQHEVRSCPPTPQRFPSPMTKLNGAPPLERGILKELVLEKEEVDGERKDEGCSSSSNIAVEEPKALDMFWFFKPCTYLGR